MEIYPVRQAALLLICIAIGFSAALCSDVFAELFERLGRRARAVLKFICDVLICILTTCFVLIFTFYFNKGDVRGFQVLGACAGVAVYRLIFSSLVRRISRRLICLALIISGIILKPVCIIFNIASKNFKKFKYYVLKSLENIIYLLYNIYCKSVILRKAENGFFKGKSALPK